MKIKTIIFISIFLLLAGYAAIMAYIINNPSEAVNASYYQAMDMFVRIVPILIAIFCLLGILAGLGKGRLWIILMIAIIIATPFMWRFASTTSDNAFIKVIVEDVELVQD